MIDQNQNNFSIQQVHLLYKQIVLILADFGPGNIITFSSQYIPIHLDCWHFLTRDDNQTHRHVLLGSIPSYTQCSHLLIIMHLHAYGIFFCLARSRSLPYLHLPSPPYFLLPFHSHGIFVQYTGRQSSSLPRMRWRADRSRSNVAALRLITKLEGLRCRHSTICLSN